MGARPRTGGGPDPGGVRASCENRGQIEPIHHSRLDLSPRDAFELASSVRHVEGRLGQMLTS